jgi:hypothetical protein
MPEMTDKSRARVKRAMGGGARCAHGGTPASCPTCMAGGGEVGVHSAIHAGSANAGTSLAGLRAKTSKQKAARGDVSGSHADLIESRGLHRENLEEVRSMKGPHGNYAEGGEVDEMPEGDSSEDAMLESCAAELMDAIHAKDKKGILDALRAIVLSMKE